MGIILGRFRKKITTYDQLTNLDTQIKQIEEYGKTTELTQKKVAGRFMLVSVFVYVVTALIFYFYFFPPTVYERLLYVIPLIAAPLVILSVKRLLTWWYNRKLKKNYNKLVTLKDQKKKMLDNVMEKETYKVAKRILEKFAPEEVIPKKSLHTSFNSTNLDTSLALSRTGPVGLRYRGLAETTGRALSGPVRDKNQMLASTMKGGKSQSNIPIVSTPLRSITSDNRALSVGTNLGMATPRLPMARTVLPRERSALDKLVDYLVGDGPSNRYALICKQCSSHNGMALREEFEYLSFHCCYCHAFNAAKKQRPPAPKLGATSSFSKVVDTSDSEKNSSTDSDSDAFAQNAPKRLQNMSSPRESPIVDAEASPEHANDVSDVAERANDVSDVIERANNVSDVVELANNVSDVVERARDRTSSDGGDSEPQDDVEPMEISGYQEKGAMESNEKD